MKDYKAKVLSNRQIARGVYEMAMSPMEGCLEPIRCGQFLHLSIPGSVHLLRRPFCIYKFSETQVLIAYAVVGGGTTEMTKLQPGDIVNLALPLGNGFTIEANQKKVVLLGGGMGCAPLLEVPKTYPDKQYYAFLGFSDKSRVAFVEDFAAIADTTVCTDDGSCGKRGYAIDALESRLKEIAPDIVLVCGPKPMLFSVKAFAEKHGIPTYVSMEERMGCGVGACLVCVCKTKKKDGTTAMSRVCADGPVFDIKEIEL